MQKLKDRLPIILSVTALVVAVFGATPAGNAVTRVLFAQNADKVDGIHASRTPAKGKLLALNDSKKFPKSVIPQLTNLSQLQGATCEAFGQTGQVSVEQEADFNNFATKFNVYCAGVFPPDQDEGNDDRGSASILTEPQHKATIAPLGDVDWYVLDLNNLCNFHNPEFCSSGMVIEAPGTLIDGDVETNPASPVTNQPSFSTGPLDVNNDVVAIKLHGTDPLVYEINISVDTA